MGQNWLGNLRHDGVMLFGKEKKMAFRGGIDVQDSETLVIFINFLGWNLSRNYLAEDALLLLEFLQFLGRHIFQFFLQGFLLLGSHLRHGKEIGYLFIKTLINFEGLIF